MNIQRSITESKPRHEYKETMFKVMLIVIAVSVLIMFIYMTLFPPALYLQYMVILLVFLCMQWGIYALWRRYNKLDLAIQLNLCLLTGAITYGCFISGGVYSSFALALLIPLTLAATMLNVRFTVSLTLLIVLLFWVLLGLELAGVLPDVPLKNLSFRMVMVTSVVIIIGLILAYHIAKMYEAEAQIVSLHTDAERLRVHQQLTVDLAHDLRTPVSVLNTSSYLIRRRFEKGLNILDQVALLDGQIKKLNDMITGFLELSKLDEMKVENKAHFIPVEIGAMLNQLAAEFRDHAYARKGILLTVEPREAEPIYVMGDEALLRRSLINLISNGIKYGREKGFIRVTYQPQGNDLVIDVADNGIGIPPNQLAQIFERFYRVDEARTSDIDTGAGIGLSVTKRIVELHNGTISVESTFGEGCVFTIRLPQQETPT